MPFEPDVPAGQHLGDSRMVDGAKVGHLFDDETNELVGHAVWREVDGEPAEVHVHNYYAAPPTPEELQAAREREEMIAARNEMIAELLVQMVARAAPHVKRWVNEKAVSPVKLRWSRLTVTRREKRRGAAEEPAENRAVAFIASPEGVEIAARATEIRMSRAEWQERLQAVMAAGAFRDEQLRILAQARIDEDVVVLDAAGDTEELTAQQFAESVGLLPAAELPESVEAYRSTRPTAEQDS